MSARRAAVLLSVVSLFLYGYVIPGVALNLFLGVFLLMISAFLMLVSSPSVVLPKGMLFSLLVVLALGSFGIFLGRGSWQNYLVQAFGIGLVVLGSAVVLGGAGRYTAKIFATYLEFSLFFALVALFELVLGLFGLYLPLLTPRIDEVLFGAHRISGLASEPSHFCLVMTPSVVAIVVSTALNRPCLSALKSGLILAAYLLTFSSVGFFILTLTVLVMLFRRSSVSSAAMKWTLTTVIAGVFFAIPQINDRIVDTYRVFLASGSAPADAEVNISSLTLFKNALVAMQSGIDQPLVGAGLGGHEQNYKAYLPSEIWEAGPNLNEKDASSLFLRLVSEFGAVFTILFYAVIVRLWTGLPRSNDPDPVFWKRLTSTAIAGLIIANSLRNGNYINHGFPFFLGLYFLTYRSLVSGDFKYGPERRGSLRSPVRRNRETLQL